MSDNGIRSIKYGDMPVVVFFEKEESTNNQLVTTLFDPREDEVERECEDFGIDPEPVLEILRKRTADTHTLAIDVDVVRRQHPHPEVSFKTL